jgi:outer membrane lipoprotein-sorting protein
MFSRRSRHRLGRAILLSLALAGGPAFAQLVPPVPQPAPPRAATPLEAISGVPQPQLAATPVATPERNQALLEAISNSFNSIRTMKGQFVQIGPFGEQSDGLFMIEKPGRVRFHYRPPVLVDVIADGRSVYVSDQNAGTQDLYPLATTPLRHLLANRIDLASIVNNVQEENDLIAVGLEESRFIEGHLTLIFDKTNYELKQWVVTDAQGYDTSVAIYEVETGVAIDPQVFSISRPVAVN